MRNLVSWPGTEPEPPALGAWRLSHWTTREVPVAFLVMTILTKEASLVAQMVKNLPTMQETWVQSLDQEDLLEKGMATHSSILAWRIPWTEESGRLQSMWSQSWTWLSDLDSLYTILTNEKVPYCSFDLHFLNNSLFLSFKGLKKLCNGTIPLFKTMGVSPHFSSVKNRLILIFLSMRNEG